MTKKFDLLLTRSRLTHAIVVSRKWGAPLAQKERVKAKVGWAPVVEDHVICVRKLIGSLPPYLSFLFTGFAKECCLCMLFMQHTKSDLYSI